MYLKQVWMNKQCKRSQTFDFSNSIDTYNNITEVEVKNSVC